MSKAEDFDPPWVRPQVFTRYYHKIHPADEVMDVMNKLIAAGYEVEDPEYIESADEGSSIPGEGNEQLFLIVGERDECACVNCKVEPPVKPRRRGKSKAD